MQNKGTTLSSFLPFDCTCTVGLSLVRGMGRWYVLEKVLGGCVLQRSKFALHLKGFALKAKLDVCLRFMVDNGKGIHGPRRCKDGCSVIPDLNC